MKIITSIPRPCYVDFSSLKAGALFIMKDDCDATINMKDDEGGFIDLSGDNAGYMGISIIGNDTQCTQVYYGLVEVNGNE